MGRNTIYCLFLCLILAFSCIYAGWFSHYMESFVTLQSKYGVSPCGILRFNITEYALEKWFIGKTTTTSHRTDKGVDASITFQESSLSKLSLFLEAIQSKCLFKETQQFLENMTKNEQNVYYLADIVNDITQIMSKFVRDPNTAQKPGIIDNLLEKYERKLRKAEELVEKEAFETSNNNENVFNDYSEEDPPYCKNLEKIFLDKYLTVDNIKYTHQMVNGMERLMCECYNENKKIGDDIGKILEKKYKVNQKEIVPEDVQSYKYIVESIIRIKDTMNEIKRNLNSPYGIKKYINTKAAQMRTVSSLNQAPSREDQVAKSRLDF